MAKGTQDMRQLIWFEDLRREDVALVGGLSRGHGGLYN